MALPAALEGLTEVRDGLASDAAGRVKTASGGATTERDAQATAAAAAALAEAGAAAGLTQLRAFVAKGASGVVVAAVREDELVRAAVDPAAGTARVERALLAWAASGAGASAAPPAPPPLARPPATPVPPPPAAAAPAASAAPAAATAPDDDPWAALRRAFVRGQLTEAAAHRRRLGERGAAPGRPGAEPLSAAEIDHAMQVLVEGIGSVLAGDGLGGARTLEALLAAPQRNLSSPNGEQPQRNLSFRWLATFWSGRAALRSGNSSGARAHVNQALALAKELDLGTVAATRWVAGEVLAHDGDHERALAYLTHARAGFDRAADRWGLAQTWLAIARVYAAQSKEREAAAAARQAAAADPAWEEPAVFVARRALARGDAGAAEDLLRAVTGPSADRVRGLIGALRDGAVTAEDAAEYLRLGDAPLGGRAIRAMERIANAAPKFLQAREALAWMLLKAGLYDAAGAIFRGLLDQQLAPAERASAMLGLGCVAHAAQRATDPDAGLRAAVTAGGAAAAAAPSPAPSLPQVAAGPLPARSSQLGAGGAVFSGQLGVFALPDVIEFVRSARRTGLLVCSSQRGMAAVHFHDGRITGATSPGAPDFGELLVGARKISSGALLAARSGRNLPDHALGSVLVREGLVDAAAVEDALRQQVERTMLELVQWKDGEFAFSREGEADEAAADAPVEFDAQDVLLTVFKHIDEARRGGAPAGPRAQAAPHR